MPLISIQELLNAHENNRVTNLALSGITNIKTGNGYFVKLVVNDASAKTVKLFDGTDASGTPFAILDAPAIGNIDYSLGFTAGLTVSAVSASNLSVIYH